MVASGDGRKCKAVLNTACQRNKGDSKRSGTDEVSQGKFGTDLTTSDPNIALCPSHDCRAYGATNQETA